MSDTQVGRDKLLHDFNEVVSDTEQLLKTIATAGGEKTQALRTSVEQNLKIAKDRLRELQEDAMQGTRAAVKNADRYVHANPWQSMAIVAGVAAVVGIVLGLLLNRRS